MSTLPATPANVPLALPPERLAGVLPRFAEHRRFAIRQRKRWLDILFNWESKNSYAVFDEDGQHVLQVKEEGAGLLSLVKRLFFRTFRPFTATVYDNPIPKPLLSIRRPFRFFFHRVDVTSAAGEPVGYVERRWSWLRRIYSVHDESGKQVAELFGPILRPWTFQVLVDGKERGLLQKRWSGLGKEMFTDADNFALEVADLDDPRIKVLTFAATVLIDVVHFERAKSH